MFWLSPYAREDIGDLQVGDLIRSTVLHQSRTGMIARIKMRGRIESIRREDVPGGQAPSFVEGLLRSKHGVVQPFKLSGHDRVYRKRTKSAQPVPRRASAVPNPERESRDPERTG